MKICAILWLHVVVMEFVHDDLTQDGLPKVDRFGHCNSDLLHFASYQVLTEDDS